MSIKDKSDTLVYSYESSVHSTNVLLSLNDQRKQDLFCDVTVIVENKSFRAHRSVLAACSDYFLSTVVWKKELDMIVTLPEEVTVKGFAPLLQFAYTSKLLLNKSNVLDVCRSVEFLGIHNIEKTCFSFLQAKLFGKNKDFTEFSRSACCMSTCLKTNLKIPVGDNENSEVDDDVEEFLEFENLKSPCPKLRKCIEVGKISPDVQNEATNSKYTCLKQSEWASSSSLCPKYRKFQLACGKERMTSWSNNLSLPNSSLEQIISKQQIGPCQNLTFTVESGDAPMRQTEKDQGGISMVGENGIYNDENIEVKKSMDVSCSVAQNFLVEESNGLAQNISGIHPTFTEEHYNLPCSQAELFVPMMLQYDKLQKTNAAVADIEGTKIEIGQGCDHPSASEKGGGDSERKSVIFSSSCSKKQSINPVSSGQSIVEREVAEHLAKGFWSEPNGSRSGCKAESFIEENNCPRQLNIERISQCPQFSIDSCQTLEENSQSTLLLHYTSSASHLSGSTNSSSKCPFKYSTGNSVCSSSSGLEELENDQGQQQGKYDDACTTNSGDDFGSESEDDSESCSAREQECELPFPVERITLLSRNDFQTMLKLHKLNPEQLDYIHDIRRRSKNRIAAQRCRKRKLDCIQNLECEIHTLLCEKEKLLQEKGQLKLSMGETWSNLSGLCKQICKEAALTPEQIQTLAKYSSPECPLSVLNTQRSLGSITRTNLIISHPGYSKGSKSMECIDEQGSSQRLQEKTMDIPSSPREGITADPSKTEQCCQTVMTDFCQEMIDKCTTDE
ncbi:transcription regulator protein BACH1-like isoform X2 [Pristis pectinata]|uniref:transcription regulator protein BACH1-like isoform X2 n=1 Tax=Pristis pectinata TaxID=685728 RepID=UPI00223DC6B9|nr:transcription regulator protein BACH1-like isoform X2 [Pristis pectinata]